MLNQAIEETTSPEDLKLLFQDSVKRRIYLDILKPLQKYRPWGRNAAAKEEEGIPPVDDKKPPVDGEASEEKKDTPADHQLVNQGADFRKVSLDQLKALLEKRFDQALAKQTPDGRPRESYEKRSAISFLLTTISFVRKPQLNRPSQEFLFPDMPERTETVVGMFYFNQSVNALANTLIKITEEVERKAQLDLEGGIYYRMAKDLKGDDVLLGIRIDSFAKKHNDRIQKIKQLVKEIQTYEYRLANLEKQKTQAKIQHNERKAYYEEIQCKLLAERKKSALYAQELEKMEQQLFEIQRKSAEAAENNLLLVEEIRKLEDALLELEKR